MSWGVTRLDESPYSLRALDQTFFLLFVPLIEHNRRGAAPKMIESQIVLKSNRTFFATSSQSNCPIEVKQSLKCVSYLLYIEDG